MRVYSDRGFKFFFLAKGEKLPDIFSDRSWIGGYVIWQRKSGMWDVRYRLMADWEEITNKQFDTENAAFQFAHEHYLNRR